MQVLNSTSLFERALRDLALVVTQACRSCVKTFAHIGQQVEEDDSVSEVSGANLAGMLKVYCDEEGDDDNDAGQACTTCFCHCVLATLQRAVVELALPAILHFSQTPRLSHKQATKSSRASTTCQPRNAACASTIATRLRFARTLPSSLGGGRRVRKHR